MGRFVLSLGLLIGSGDAGGVPSFALIVHQSNPNTNLMLADVRAFFSGDTKQWPNGSKLVLVERDTGSVSYQFLLAHILHMGPIEYKRRLLSIEFSGEAPVILKVLNSEQAACKFVFNVPGAIGLIETHSLNLPECGGVRTVRIDGRLPGQEGYRLQ
jgi:hypothetical protein